MRSETKGRWQFSEIVDKKSFQAKDLTIGRWESSDLMYLRKQLADHKIHFQPRSWQLVDENHLTWCIWGNNYQITKYTLKSVGESQLTKSKLKTPKNQVRMICTESHTERKKWSRKGSTVEPFSCPQDDLYASLFFGGGGLWSPFALLRWTQKSMPTLSSMKLKKILA